MIREKAAMEKIIEKIGEFIFSPSGLLVLALMILLAGKYIFKKDYLNCFEIIEQHWKCYEDRDGNVSKVTMFLYYGVPFLLALSLVQIKETDEDIINSLTVIVSILTSMFFTLLTLILDMYKRIKTDTNYNDANASISLKLLKETYYAIMFEILMSIVILIMCFIYLFAEKYSYLGSVVLYYFAFVLLMNLFMILKRVYKVIQEDLNVSNS